MIFWTLLALEFAGGINRIRSSDRAGRDGAMRRIYRSKRSFKKHDAVLWQPQMKAGINRGEPQWQRNYSPIETGIKLVSRRCKGRSIYRLVLILDGRFKISDGVNTPCRRSFITRRLIQWHSDFSGKSPKTIPQRQEYEQPA